MNRLVSFTHIVLIIYYMTECIYTINSITLMFNVEHGYGFIDNINLDSVGTIIKVTIYQIMFYFVSM